MTRIGVCMSLIALRPLTAVDFIAIEVEGCGHTHTHTQSAQINTTTTLPCQHLPLPARHDRVREETGRARGQRKSLSQNSNGNKDMGQVPDLPFRNSQKSIPLCIHPIKPL